MIVYCCMTGDPEGEYLDSIWSTEAAADAWASEYNQNYKSLSSPELYVIPWTTDEVPWKKGEQHDQEEEG